MQIEQELIRFLSEKYSVNVDENEPLIDSGLIDSLVLLELVTFIEKRTGGRVPDEAVTHDNFQNVASIAALARKLAGAPQTA